MRRQGKGERPENKEKKGKVNGKPLTDKMEKKGPLRVLMHGGAFVDARVSDGEYIKILDEGELGRKWKLKRKSLNSNPEAVGYADVKGMGTVKITIEITDCSFFRLASNTLREAGVSEDFVRKVGEIEVALKAGNHDLVDELCGLDLDPGPALGGIEGAFIRKKDKDSE